MEIIPAIFLNLSSCVYIQVYAKPPFVFTKISKIRCAIRINYCEYIRLATYFSCFLRNVTHEIMNIKHVCMKYAFQHAYWVENYSTLLHDREEFLINTYITYDLSDIILYITWNFECVRFIPPLYTQKKTASIGTCRYMQWKFV